MMRSKNVLQKCCAWLLTVATVIGGIPVSATEMKPESTTVESQQVEENPTGKIYLKLNAGGEVLVNDGDSKKSYVTEGDKVSEKDANGVSTDISASLEDGYILIATGEVGKEISVEARPKSGYLVETYKILSDRGKVLSTVESKSSVVPISKDTKYLEINFSKEQVKELEEKVKESNETETTEKQEASNTNQEGLDLSTYKEVGKITWVDGTAGKPTVADSNPLYSMYRIAPSTSQGSTTISQGKTSGSSQGYYTHEYNLSGTKTGSTKGICANGSKDSPGGQTFGYGTVSTSGTGTNALILAALLTSPYSMSDGDSEANAIGAYKDKSVWSPLSGVDDLMAVHGFISWVNGDGMGYWSQHYASALSSVKSNLISWIKNHESEMNRSTLYCTNNSNSYQNIVWCTTVYKTYGKAKAKKVSSWGMGWEKNNDMYSLEGAKFNIYDSDDNYVDTLITDANGNTSAVTLETGSYYFRETKAPKGYILDNITKYPFKVYDDETTTVTISDKPSNDPASLVIRKEPDAGCTTSAVGNTTVEGAQYTLEYYDNASWSGTPRKTWVYETSEDGEIDFLLDEPLKGALYVSIKGHNVFPAGTYKVYETKSPKGFLLDETVYKASVTSATNYNWEWRSGNPKTVKSSTTSLGEVPYRGGVSVSKKDSETKENLAQGSATFEGIEFTIYNKSKNPVTYKNKLYKKGEAVCTIKADKNGVAKTADKALEYGDYTIKETKGNDFYNICDTEYDFTVKKDGQHFEFEFEDTVKRGGLKLVKQDLDLKASTPQGEATLEGIEFEIITEGNNPILVDGVTYNKGDTVCTLTTSKDENGEYSISTPADVLPLGYYTVKEVKTNDSYMLTQGPITVVLSKEGELTTVKKDGSSLVAQNLVVKGGVEICKQDSQTEDSAQGDATLQNAIFTIYNESENAVFYKGKIANKGEAVTTISTVYENGRYIAKTSTDALPFGIYSIEETSSPKGYNLAKYKKSFAIRKNGEMVSLVKEPCKDDVIRGGVKIQKNDEDLRRAYAQGDATLQGAVYGIYNESSQPVVVNNKTYEKGKLVTQITTDVNGVAKTSSDTLPYGTYSIKELSPSRGYLLDTSFNPTFTIREEGVIVDLSKDEPSYEPVIRGGIKLQKQDRDLERIYAQGDATLQGAVYTVYNNSIHDVYVRGRLYKPGEKILDMTTDANGYTSISSDTLPYGSYIVKETKASQGYNIDTNFVKYITIRTDGQVVNLTATSSSYEPVIRGGVQVQKWDIDLDKSEAIGSYNHSQSPHNGAHLDGVKFDIVNKSVHNVYVQGVEYKPGEKVMTISTHWNEELKAYTAETPRDGLPYGTYTIQEVYTHPSYHLLDNSVKTFVIRKEGVMVTSQTNGKDFIYKNRILRGDFEFVKMAEGTNDRICTPFILTNTASGESHIIVTDKNGQFSSHSSVNAHSKNTNNNDHALETLKKDPKHVFVESDFDYNSGIWFGMGEDGSMADIQDERGALPYGEYELTEVRCENNAALKLVQFKFQVYKEGITAHLGTVVDEWAKPEITTKAWNKETKQQVSKSDGTITIVDTVKIVGLKVGDTYKVRGKFTDYNDEGVVLKSNGKQIKAETTFTATKVVEEVDLEYTFDASNFHGMTGVMFEYLYHNGELVSSEENIDNVDQTVWFPEIKTHAFDVETEDEVASSTLKSITDKVSYSNVKPNETYKMCGKLIDKDTKEVIAESSTIFTAETSDGSVDVQFYLGDKDVAGKTLVATESLELNGQEVCLHEDLEDKAQTVYFPKLKTKASDSITESHVGTILKDSKFVDEVAYSNLVIGKKYTVRGTLMDRDTGKPITIEGKTFTAEKTFVAKETNGKLTLEFDLNTSQLVGKTVVAFEDLYYKGINVATHSDLSDEKQSVHYPEIHTNASDINTESHVGMAGETTVIDRVSYNNLVIGQEYTIRGTLMDKDTGDYLGKDLGKEPIIATTTFVPTESEGYIELLYNIDDASVISGKTTVVFEDLYYNGKKLISHADLEDVEQTVRYPELKTQASVDNMKDILAEKKEITLTDVVSYKNLVAGEEYEISGTLMLQGSKKPLMYEDKPITSSIKFTPNTNDGTVELKFIIPDASLLEGETVVVFEDLLYKGIKVATHSEITDYEQSVNFPKISTTAVDGKTELNEGVAENLVKLVDTVSYSNLEAGANYTVRGTLYEKSTGEPFLVDGNPVTSEVMFSPSSKDGTKKFVSGSVDVVFEFDATSLRGKKVVVFEDLYRDGILIATHSDINDEGQTVSYPEIHTNATVDGIQETLASDFTITTLVDRVTYSNLIVGNAYTLHATLMDKETGKPLLLNKHEVTAKQEFTPTEAEGYVDVTFVFPSKGLEGKTVVVFESLRRGTKEVAIHSDINDLDQTVRFPKLVTSAIDKATGMQEGLKSDKTTIIDTVNYSNLTVGDTYKVVSEVYSHDTKKLLKSTSKEVTFTAESSSGTVDTEIEFNSSKSTRVTVYEHLFNVSRGNVRVASHVDSTDENQTVVFSELATTALDKVSGTHEQQGNKKSIIVDTVNYKGLVVGHEYTISGKLMDKATNKPLRIKGKEITASKTFKAKTPNGSVNLEFSLDSSALVGKTIVAFEDLYVNSKQIATHSDINDEDQTVYIIGIGTKASSTSGSKELEIGSDITLVDKVSYKNLTGSKYILKGSVIDKKTGDVVAKASISFKPEKANGVQAVNFKVNTEKLVDKELVVFEELYDTNGKLVAAHKDINDEGQTVKVKERDEIHDLPKTSDNTRNILLLGVILIFMGVVLIYLVTRKKKN